jgi:(1->4)-alpha-D-glucan 1-alpha-D-glucosylmutase
VQELAASARVYRTYVTRSGPSPADASILEGLLDGVRLRRPDVPAPLVAFAAHLFSTGGGDDADGLDFITRFQQLCTAVAAKAGEDTAFYRYNRCIALNEVGADPGVFSTDVNTFHRTIQAWQQQYPRGMRSTSTHDSKRSEDVRARLTVLSEFIEPWTALVQRWAARSDAHRIDGQPDGNFEYYLYQTMVGAWPLSRERAHVHAEKAARESKLFTDWLSPSAEYERILHHFVDALYDDSALIEELTAFVESLHPADWHKALSQLLLKLTIPGVPDVYQGSELWHLALTDPDNRATVDFNARRLLLDECATLPANAVLSRMDEGLPKLWTIERTLALKHRHRDLDGSAPYQPLEVTGSRAAHVLAFLRGSALAVVVPTRTAPGDWHDTRVVLPAGSWVHVLGEAVVDGGECPVGTLFHHFPVALLERSAP